MTCGLPADRHSALGDVTDATNDVEAPGAPRARGRRVRAPWAVAAEATLFVVAGAVALAVGAGAASVGSATGPVHALDAARDVASVDPGIVDVNTVLGADGSSAGTGIVLTASGDVLTNNHVVQGATSIDVTDVGNGRTYAARVVGTDVGADVALLKLVGASGLATVRLGGSWMLGVGEGVVAVGNAGGVGGTPSVATGSITSLGQRVAASNAVWGSTEQLTGMVETDASLQPGDSGGPLVDSSGQVLGLDTAASSGAQRASGPPESFAIPIDAALGIARQIVAGVSSSAIHLGPAAFLGVDVEPSDRRGATVVGVDAGSPAQSVGLSSGDVIIRLGGERVSSIDALTAALEGLRPHDAVAIEWTDASGASHRAVVRLATGPTP